ncbi:MAG: leucyl/phenylalanyl-tRNA--protein transferase [Opitutales bacterium]
MGIFLLDDNHPEFFPDPRLSDDHGLVAVSKGLGIKRLITAYRQGIFPWMKMECSPNYWCWFSPDPRMCLYPDEFKVPRSLKKALKERRFQIRVDQNFEEVMRRCAEIKRSHESSSWIETDMIEQYSELHRLGIAHSIEAYEAKQLVGGLYGLAMGRVFFGESMFHQVSEASKACMACLVKISQLNGIELIDCQVYNQFLQSLGAREVAREDFLSQLKDICQGTSSSADWKSYAQQDDLLLLP